MSQSSKCDGSYSPPVFMAPPGENSSSVEKSSSPVEKLRGGLKSS